MTKRSLAVLSAGALVLLLASAGSGRAQGPSFPAGPLGPMAPFAGYRSYIGGLTGYAPAYTFTGSAYYIYGLRPYMVAPAISPTIYGTPSSLAVSPVRYVAYYPPVYSGSSPAVAPAAPLLPDNRATVELTVPADAEVLFDGQKTSQKGTHRVFTTPALEPGQTYHYQVTARWPGGPAGGQTQTVHVSAGKTATVVFPKPKP